MICPKCNQEMRKGYLFSSKDGAFSFADEVLEYSQMREQPKDLLKSHRLRRATERKWKLVYVRIAG